MISERPTRAVEEFLWIFMDFLHQFRYELIHQLLIMKLQNSPCNTAAHAILHPLVLPRK